ncbi:MAG: UDP-N-acetylmuramoyl-L-alanyl-D-glutamate--2,6-diaminopimelate ligase [Candidatus Omnitrophica bacterium]|nr:UDP-N-acetylmuramoyl-L-alanyl-D-glutamate--2,6-diaminopimelate ligase [Candidatus Omnitrophota bacterium]
MKLKELLPSNIDRSGIDESFLELEIQSVSCDSRDIAPQSIFVALSGMKYRGNDFIHDAVSGGAVVIVRAIGDEISESLALPAHVLVLDVEDPKKFLYFVAEKFYGSPSQKVKVFGVTGTNGKTTITYLLESIALAGQKKCAVIGTINYRVGREILPSKNTTPSLLDNQKFLHRLAADHIEYSFMEVSSHALIQGRVDLINFRVAVFTNLTGDHLDYHKTMEEYFRAKSLLFKNLSRESIAVINCDDPYGQQMMAVTPARIFTYGLSLNARIRAKNIEFSFDGSSMDIETPAGPFQLKTALIGMHNVYNILAAVGAGLAEGIQLDIICEGLKKIKCIPGRLEKVSSNRGFFIFIDYAHTEDGLRNVLQALRATGKSRIITVFGCGGDRDKTKRPKMGRIAGEFSDVSIVTTDNPRSEDPQRIIDEIIAGFQKNNYECIIERTQAIRRALTLAEPGDVVLIAGKGHETYQIFKDHTIEYDERQVIKEFLEEENVHTARNLRGS